MQHARVAVYQVKSGGAPEAFHRAERDLLPIFEAQPGFVSYSVVVTSDTELISISAWESKEAAEAAVSSAAHWVRDNIAELIESVDNRVGEIAFSNRLKAPAGGITRG